MAIVEPQDWRLLQQQKHFALAMPPVLCQMRVLSKMGD